MTNKRYEIYKNFKKYVLNKDDRTMNDICISPTNEFQLQAQQNFLKEYMIAYPKWDKLLLFHNIGAGKTCTSITMAEEYLKTHPNNKIKVILPARLKTNFFDEMISPCGMNAYISNDDFIKFQSSSTSKLIKKQIKKKFMTAIEKKYEIMSFERLKSIVNKPENCNRIIEWVKDFTKDSMLIIDEVHNLVSDKYDNVKFLEMVSTKKLIKGVKGLNTIIFKLITQFADNSTKMVFMTATPIFDNISQLQELVKIMAPDAVINKNNKISNVIDNLRGKVSYFPGTSINAYPSIKYDIHEIPVSITQDIIISQIIDESTNEKDDNKESFMSKQRQASLACLPGNKQIKGNIDQILNNMNEYCPKIALLLKLITNNPGKHLVYSSFVQTGVNIVEKVLQNAGWISIQSALKDKILLNSHIGKIYATWAGNVKDADKQMIKSIINAKDNIFGDHIRVIIGSPSIKEGVSFKHIQHLHLLDPVWNQSAKTQVEGRAIRFCSHVDIIESIDKPLLRSVTINIYKLIPRIKGLVKITSDQTIYDDIIPRKKKLVEAGEAALKKVAIDHYLFRNLYSVKPLPNPISPINSAKSEIEFSTAENINFYKKTHKDKTKTTCPKARRPNIETNMCLSNYFKKKNNQNFDCCYKDKKTKVIIENKVKETKISKCPKNRKPVNGICQEGFHIKQNKLDEPCCYKNTKITKL